MSDVIWAAVIAGGVSVVGNAVTLGVAHITTRTESARLKAEGRDARRVAYHRALVNLEELDMVTSAYADPPTAEKFAVWIVAYRERQAELRLLESPAIAEARKDFAKLIEELAERMEKAGPAVPFDDRLGVPYVEMRERFNEAGRALSQAMRDDLGLSSEG